MGKVSKEIVEGNVEKIVEELNKALADEWLAFIQYTLTSQIVTNGYVSQVFDEIAKEELEHAQELAERIIILNGKPLISPKQFLEKSNCGYSTPVEEVKKSLQDGIKGEGCAIRIYNKILKLTKDSDPITYALILHILEEEEKHEQKFENLLTL